MKLFSRDRLVFVSTAVVILFITAIVYIPALDYRFVNLDDEMYVVNNGNIASLDLAFSKH